MTNGDAQTVGFFQRVGPVNGIGIDQLHTGHDVGVEPTGFLTGWMRHAQPFGFVAKGEIGG